MSTSKKRGREEEKRKKKNEASAETRRAVRAVQSRWLGSRRPVRIRSATGSGGELKLALCGRVAAASESEGGLGGAEGSGGGGEGDEGVDVLDTLVDVDK